jgi:hypothetical protein
MSDPPTTSKAYWCNPVAELLLSHNSNFITIYDSFSYCKFAMLRKTVIPNYLKWTTNSKNKVQYKTQLLNIYPLENSLVKDSLWQQALYVRNEKTQIKYHNIKVCEGGENYHILMCALLLSVSHFLFLNWKPIQFQTKWANTIQELIHYSQK